MCMEIITTVTAVAAMLTAFAALWTVKEIKKQRESSYKPELYIGQSMLYVYGEIVAGRYLPFRFSNKRLGIEINRTTERTFDFNLNVFNLGAGAAKAVKFRWLFNIERILEVINKSNKIGFFHLYEESELIYINIPRLNYKINIVKLQSIYDQDANFILPMGITDLPTLIAIPRLYLQLNMIFFCCHMDFYSEPIERNKKKTRIEDFPPIRLNIRYKDRDGGEIQKSFNVSVKYNFVTLPNQFIDPLDLFGEFEIVSEEV